MFDKLIESNSIQAEFKPRRKFFMVSSVVVGIAFLSAVVFSLYAQNIDLGTDSFELVEMIAPVEPDAPEPEPPRQQPQQRNQQTDSEVPSRQDMIARLAESQLVPNTISTTRNLLREMPVDRFRLDPNRPESDGAGSTGPDGNERGTSSASGIETSVSENVKLPAPPPSIKREVKKPVTQSKGVINGDAISLPKPPYPPVARATNLTGIVNVQVLIDERGEVVSAKAVDGHPFFRLEAERAARKARFRPTLLSDQPVKVSGLIVYKFTK